MDEDIVATSTITINAAAGRVWSVITDPVAAREFMFGTELPAHSKGMWDRLVQSVKEIAERN